MVIILLTSGAASVVLERLDYLTAVSKNERMWIIALVGITSAVPAYDDAAGSWFGLYFRRLASAAIRTLPFLGGLLLGGRLLQMALALPEYLSQVIAGIAVFALGSLALRLVRMVLDYGPPHMTNVRRRPQTQSRARPLPPSPEGTQT